MTTYAEFLAHKQRTTEHHGIDLDHVELHPSLFPHQAHVIRQAAKRGRMATFLDAGLGKTRIQLTWAAHSGVRTLIFAPLSVTGQTVTEAAAIDIEAAYVRSDDQATGPGVWVTNYEMAEHFDPAGFDAVVLDESSILKNHTGARRNHLIEAWAKVPRRLACTATPAPNDVTELANHAEFLGTMSRVEMLAAWFVHDDEGWRLKGHASDAMYRWMATWAAAARRPSDLGDFDDTPYQLPELRIHAETVEHHDAPEGQLFTTDIGGVGGRAKIRKATMAARIQRTVELVDGRRGTPRVQPPMGGEEPGSHPGVPPADGRETQRSSSEEVRRDPGAPGQEGRRDQGVEGQESTQAPSLDVRVDGGATRGMARQGLHGLWLPSDEAPRGPLPLDGQDPRGALPAVQPGPGAPGGRSGTDHRASGVRAEEPWIIWCGLNVEQDALEQAFGDRAISVKGTMKPEEKVEAISAWQDGERPILLTKPAICGWGLNLQRASRMVFVGIGDSYEAYYQAIRRSWRFGQHRPVDVHIVVSEIERQIVENVRRKESGAADMTDRLVTAMRAATQSEAA